MFVRSLYRSARVRCQLQRNLKSKPEVLQELQRKKLRDMIEYAYNNVPFYHRKFDEALIKPDDVKSVEDLAKVPVTTKNEIQKTSFEDIVSRNINFDKCLRRMTSGSTGIPLTVFLSEEVQDIERALFARAYFEDGLNIRNKMVRITDRCNFPQGRSWFQRLGILRTRYVSVLDDVERQFSIIEDFKPNAVHGYTSCVELLADFCKENQKNISPLLIFTSAELLDRKARQLINSVFQTKLFDLYVSVEFGLMAWECNEHLGYHINADSVVLEIVRNHEVVGSNELGEMVCTSLTNKVMPLIRYKIGDMGTALDEKCSCGVTLPLLKIIEGRTGDFLMTTDGKIIPPTIFFPYPFEDVTWIKQFRIIQQSRRKIIFQIAVRDSFESKEVELKMAQAKVKKVFGADMDVIFQIVEEIKPDSSGKLRKIMSNVNTII